MEGHGNLMIAASELSSRAEQYGKLFASSHRVDWALVF